MIHWLASYPRSGNTLFRITLRRAFGIETPTAYPGNDWVAEHLGRSFVGAPEGDPSLEALARRGEPCIVKTHRRAPDDRPAIYLVRDGRDSLVSYAHHVLAREGVAPDDPRHAAAYDAAIRALISETDSSTGSWGQSVCHWLSTPRRRLVIVRFEDRIADPERVVSGALDALGWRHSPPTVRGIDFSRLHAKAPAFFRRGVVGSHRDEMRDTIADLFWSVPENVQGMRLLGYTRDPGAG